MSWTSQGPDWWQASDGKWYPPPGVVTANPGVGPYGSQVPGGQPNVGYGPAPSYGIAPGYPGPVATPGKSGLAIASMVVSIAGIVSCGLGFIVGLILGIVALGQFSKPDGPKEGKGFAIAGVIVGLAGIVLILVGVLLAYLNSYNCQTGMPHGWCNTPYGY